MFLSKRMNKVYSLSLLFFSCHSVVKFCISVADRSVSTTISNVLLSEERSGAALREPHRPIILCITFALTDPVLKNSCDSAVVKLVCSFFCFNLTCEENFASHSREIEPQEKK